MKFKKENLKEEYDKISQSLKILLGDLDMYLHTRFGYEMTITELLRTQEMQDEYYKNDPKYKIKKWRSVHQDGRGADIRTSDMSEQIKIAIEQWFATRPYDPKRPELKSFKFHDVGKGDHLHCQSLE